MREYGIVYLHARSVSCGRKDNMTLAVIRTLVDLSRRISTGCFSLHVFIALGINHLKRSHQLR